MALKATAITFQEACDFVQRHHRHHKKPQGMKFCIGAVENGSLVGVIIVGRPVSRRRDDGSTLEITRCCTDGTRNACSFLYGRAAKAAHALGYTRIGTYILPSENGTSLKAAGWRLLYQSKPTSSNWTRNGVTKYEGPSGQKLLFEKDLT